MYSFNKIIILLFIGFLLWMPIRAQDFELDLTFHADYSFYSQSNYFRPIIFNLIESNNNKLYISGRCYDAPILTLIRFDSLGNFDQLFQPNDGFSSRLFNFKFQGDVLCSVGRKGTMYSDFHSYDEIGNIINPSWSQNFHNAFNLHASQNGHLYDNGNILYVGDFNLAASSSIDYDIVRINTNGFPDTSLMVDVYSGSSDVIWEIEPYDDKLLVFGRWNSWLGNYLVEDGLQRIYLPSCTMDTSFHNVIENVPDSGFFSWLTDILILKNGKIIITGKFKLSGIQMAQGIARLNSDGSIDTTFNNTNNLFDSYNMLYSINTITLLHDSTGYLIGGFFESYQGHERHCIVKTDLNGFIDPLSFNGPGVDTIGYIASSYPSDYSWGVTQILPTKNGKYYIGGQIDGFNGTTTQPVFRIQPATVGVADKQMNNDVIVYPNPANNFVGIEWELSDVDKSTQINIYSAKGQQIDSYTLENAIGVLKIVTSEYADGVYYFELVSDNQIIKKGKFIILH